MTRYARIDQSGLAVEFIDTDLDIKTLFHPALTWVPAGADVQAGWTYANGVFAAPQRAPFDPADAIPALTAMTDRFQLVVSLMQVDYLAAGDAASATACTAIKAQFDALASDAALTGAASRQAFNTAARAKLRAIAASAPPAVLTRLKRDPNLA